MNCLFEVLVSRAATALAWQHGRNAIDATWRHEHRQPVARGAVLSIIRPNAVDTVGHVVAAKDFVRTGTRLRHTRGKLGQSVRMCAGRGRTEVHEEL